MACVAPGCSSVTHTTTGVQLLEELYSKHETDFPEFKNNGTPFKVLVPRLFQHRVPSQMYMDRQGSIPKQNRTFEEGLRIGDLAEESVFDFIKESLFDTLKDNLFDRNSTAFMLSMNDFKIKLDTLELLKIESCFEDNENIDRQFDFIIIHAALGVICIEIKGLTEPRSRARGGKQVRACSDFLNAMYRCTTSSCLTPQEPLLVTTMVLRPLLESCTAQISSVRVTGSSFGIVTKNIKSFAWSGFHSEFKEVWLDLCTESKKMTLPNEKNLVTLCKWLIGLYFYGNEKNHRRNGELKVECEILRFQRYTREEMQIYNLDKGLTNTEEIPFFQVALNKIGISFVTDPQKELLNKDRAIVLGGAGTGKTVMVMAKAMQKAQLGKEEVIIFAPRAVSHKYKTTFDAYIRNKNVQVVDIIGNTFDKLVFEKTSKLFCGLEKATKQYFDVKCGPKPENKTEYGDISLSTFSNVLRCLLENACLGQSQALQCSAITENKPDVFDRWINALTLSSDEIKKECKRTKKSFKRKWEETLGRLTEEWEETRKLLKAAYNGKHIFFDDAFSEFVRQIVYGRYTARISEGKISTNNVVLHTAIVMLWLVDKCQRDEWNTCLWIVNDMFQINNGYSRFFHNKFCTLTVPMGESLNVDSYIGQYANYFRYIRAYKKEGSSFRANYGSLHTFLPCFLQLLLTVGPTKNQSTLAVQKLPDVMRSAIHIIKSYEPDLEVINKDIYGSKFTKKELCGGERHKVPGEHNQKEFKIHHFFNTTIGEELHYLKFIDAEKNGLTKVISYILEQIRVLRMGDQVTCDDIAILTPNVYETQEYFLQHYIRFQLEQQPDEIRTCIANLQEEKSILVDFAFNALSQEKLVVFSICYKCKYPNDEEAAIQPYPGVYISKSRCQITLYEIVLDIDVDGENAPPPESYIPLFTTPMIDVAKRNAAESNNESSAALSLDPSPSSPVGHGSHSEEDSSGRSMSSDEEYDSRKSSTAISHSGATPAMDNIRISTSPYREYDYRPTRTPMHTNILANEPGSQGATCESEDAMDASEDIKKSDIINPVLSSSQSGCSTGCDEELQTERKNPLAPAPCSHNFTYNFALVSPVPDYKPGPGESVDVVEEKQQRRELVRREHAELIDALRRLNIDVLDVPLDGNHNGELDVLFINDIAVVIDGTVVMCNPNGSHRQAQIDATRKILTKMKEISNVSVADTVSGASGNDVLWIGGDVIFIGLSEFTTPEGAQKIEHVYKKKNLTTVTIDIRPLNQQPNSFHLRDLVAIAGPNVFAVFESHTIIDMMCNAYNTKTHKDLRSAWNFIPSLKDIPKELTGEEKSMSNVIFAGNVLLQLDAQQIPHLSKIYNKEVKHPRISICMKAISETTGRRSCLSSCVLLVHEGSSKQESRGTKRKISSEDLPVDFPVTDSS